MFSKLGILSVRRSDMADGHGEVTRKLTEAKVTMVDITSDDTRDFL